MTVQEAGHPNLARSDHGSVTVLTLNSPARRNALSEAMLDALADALASIAADRAVRVVVLAAAGPAYSAGHDLKELAAHRLDADRGRAYFADIMNRCARVMQAIVGLPQPVIAQVQGVATAAGCQLVASCDLALAASTASFSTPGVNIGLFCSTPMVALSRNVAAKHAMEMLLTGETVSADAAVRLGLVNRAVDPAVLEAETMELGVSHRRQVSLVVKIGKEAFYRQREMTLADAYAYAAEVMVENMLARDAEEGIAAFIEKRSALWEDR